MFFQQAAVLRNAQMLGSFPLRANRTRHELTHKQSKKGDKYIERMSQTNKDKIGGKNIIDKQWAEKPMSVIKSPHKLTEVELYQTLQKIVEMPEKRLKTMIK